MIKPKIKRKILCILLLGSIFISIMILPNYNLVYDNKVNDNTLILPSEQPDQTLDNTPPQLSALAPDIIYNSTYKITQSEDDAWNRINPLPRMNCTSQTLLLGGSNLQNNNAQRKTCLRWNVSIPKGAHIISAYINLTYSTSTSYDGFRNLIVAFDNNATPPFDDPSENVRNRLTVGAVTWNLAGSYSTNQTIQSPDIATLLQNLVTRNDWTTNSPFGLFIIPNAYVSGSAEIIEFWSYDNGNPIQTPKLFVEWNLYPWISDTPEDIYIQYNSSGYFLDWTVWDDNPTTFTVTCDRSVLGIPYEGTWQAGVVRYELPVLDLDIYTLTAYFNDTDGNLIWDSVIVKAILVTKVFNITQSADDAYSFNNTAGITDYTSTNLTIRGPSQEADDNQARICLRFNCSIPKNAKIHEAYLNITSSETISYAAPTGFAYRFHIIQDPATPDFSDTGENVHARLTDDRNLAAYRQDEPYPNLIQNQTLKTNVEHLVQYIVGHPDWKSKTNNFIGFIIRPGNDPDWSSIRYFNFWSFDSPDPKYSPKLKVVWEDTPFITHPADQTINNNTLGYHIDWTAMDDNPAISTIECNYTGSFVQVQSGSWQSGLEISYDIPKLDIGVFDYIIVNYIINITDADGNFVWDSVHINVTDLIALGLPTFSDVRLLQGDANFTYGERDYFICGDGPFSLQMFNSTPVNNIELHLTAYYPNYQLYFELGAFWRFEPYTYDYSTVLGGPMIFELNYSAETGNFNFTPPSWAYYSWVWWNRHHGSDYIGFYMNWTINSISYNVLNFLSITFDGGSDFIVEDTVYQVYLMEILNKDIHPPKYGNPEFVEPDEPDKHYEIDILVWEDEHESGVDEVLLYYMVDDDGKWREIFMVLSQGLYSAEIPPQPDGVALDYYIVIIDVAGNSITTKVYSEKTVDFEANPVIVPLLILILAMIGAISTVIIYKLLRRIFSKKPKMEMKMEPKKKNTEI